MSESNRSSASLAQRAITLHHILIETAPAGIEPAPPERQSGVLAVIL